MKRVADFVKTCLVGGVLAILPILLTAFILAEAITVLVPNAPTPSVGMLRVLPRERVTRLSTPAASAANCFMQWGIGSKRLLAQQG